jgi:hypothetical protein
MDLTIRDELRPSRLGSFDLTLAVIMLVAIALRFFNLGVPDPIFDELLHAATSRLSFSELFEYINKYREGLMYYFFVIKLASIFGSAEWILRLPAALGGTVGVFFCFRLGEALAGRSAGYIAAVLAAVNMMLIWHSRLIMAYGFFFCLDSLSIFLFYKTLESNFRSRSLALALVNAVSILIYPAGFFLSIVECGVLAIFLLRSWPSSAKYKATIFYMFQIIPMACLLYKSITFPANQTNGSFLLFETNLLSFIHGFSTVIVEAASPWNHINAWSLFGVVFFIIGICMLAKKNKTIAFSALALAIIPGAGMYFTINEALAYQHRVTYALPLCFVITSIALAKLIPRALRLLIPLSVCAAAGYIFFAHFDDFYGPNPDKLPYKLAHFRELAKELNVIMQPNSPIIFPEINIFRDLRWYLSDYPDNHILTQAITPGDGDITVYFLSHYGDFGHPSSGEKDFFVPNANDTGIPLDPYNTLYSRVIHRTSATANDSIFLKLDIDFKSRDYFQSVYAQRKVLIKPYFGGRLVPIENSNDCWFMEKIAFNQPANRTIFGNITYDNTVDGNIIEVEVSSDGINFQPAHYGLRKGMGIVERFCLFMPKLNQELYVRVKLKTKSWPPGQYLFNADTLRLARFQLYSCDENQASVCDMYNIAASSPVDGNPVQLSSNMQINYQNVIETPSQEMPGWKFIESANSEDTGKVYIQIKKSGTLSLYPRVGNVSDSVKIVNADSGRQLLFLSGFANTWTPMGMRYDLPLDDLPDGKDLKLEISLTGKGQLWLKGSSLLFSPQQ